MKSVAFFNNKGGVGKTSLVYHIAAMCGHLGVRVLAVDLDPQANLTTMFFTEEDLEGLWPADAPGESVLAPILPLLEGEGGIGEPHVHWRDDVGLLVGDLDLSNFEDELSQQWPRCSDGDKRAFKVIGAFYEVIQRAGRAERADLVLIDVGPNLGAINRAALLAADNVVVPLAPDLFSLKGLENLGPRLRQWRAGWEERLQKRPKDVLLPTGAMEPIGYVVVQHAVRLDRPVKAYEKWIERIPSTYARAVLDQEPGGLDVASDPHCLGMLKHYRSLMPLAQEARKPMFDLTPADGAIGAHATAVQSCYQDFRELTRVIAARAGIEVPSQL